MVDLLALYDEFAQEARAKEKLDRLALPLHSALSLKLAESFPTPTSEPKYLEGANR